MTEKDRPQLPPPAWYTLEDVAQRWNCKIEQVIHYGEADMLRISVRARGPFRVMWRNDMEKFAQEAQWQKYEIKPIGLQTEFFISVLESDMPQAMFFGANTTKGEKYDFCLVHGYSPESQPHVSVKDLVIVREEIDRFEREYRIGAHSGELPQPAPELGERERQTLLALIAAILQTIMDKGPFKSQAELVEYLVEEYGMSKRTIDGKLAEAKKALQNK